MAQDEFCLRIECLFSKLECIIEIVDDSMQHFFMKEEECVCASVKRVCHFAGLGLLVDHVVDDGDDGLGEIIEVEDRRVGIETDSVELVAILNREGVTRWMCSVSWLKRLYYSILFPVWRA